MGKNMGFLKELGSFVGEVAGGIVGGTVNVVGELTGSEFIEEMGDGIKKASSFAGEKLGEAASCKRKRLKYTADHCIFQPFQIFRCKLYGKTVESPPTLLSSKLRMSGNKVYNY
jgi:hypothetical protein